VQCDGCQLWFHFHCIGLDREDIGEHDDYVCGKCKTSSDADLLVDVEDSDQTPTRFLPPISTLEGYRGVSEEGGSTSAVEVLDIVDISDSDDESDEEIKGGMEGGEEEDIMCQWYAEDGSGENDELVIHVITLDDGEDEDQRGCISLGGGIADAQPTESMFFEEVIEQELQEVMSECDDVIVVE